MALLARNPARKLQLIRNAAYEYMLYYTTQEAYVTGDKMSSSLLKDIKKRVELFVAGQATSDTPFVGPPDGI